MNGRLGVSLATLLGAAVAAPALLAAGENPGVTAAPILQMPIGARAIGMGSAFTGVASDVSALYFNPAGLCNMNDREVSMMYQKGYAGQQTEFGGFVTPLPFGGLVGDGYATLGGGVLLNDNGSILVNRTQSDGSFLDSQTVSAGNDIVATLGYAERVFDFSIDRKDGPITFDHFMGVNAKYIHSSLAQAYSASAAAGDLGYFLRSPELGSSLGLSMLNFGSKMRFLQQGDYLPLTFRGGVAVQPDIFQGGTLPPAQSITFAGDAEYLYYERQLRGYLGAEYSLLRTIALRLGYQLNRDNLGLTFGFGLAWRGLCVDYAWSMGDAFGDTQRFSFTYKFGRQSQRSREAGRRPFIESMPEREDLQDIEQRTPRTLEAPRRPRASPTENQTDSPGWIY